MKKPYLSVVIPCYNEEKRLGQGLGAAIKYLDRQIFDSELIFVNDGSTDKTLDLLQKVKNQREKIIVISYYPNCGKGYAVRQGVMVSGGEWVLICDADFSISIEHLERFLKNAKENDVVVGSKKLSNSRAVEKQILIRRFLGWGFTKLTNIVLDTNISDVTCGFKLFKGEVARRILAKQLIYNWSYDAETFFLLRRFNYRVSEVPVKWRDVKGSKVNIINSIAASFLGLIRIRMNDLFGKYDK